MELRRRGRAAAGTRRRARRRWRARPRDRSAGAATRWTTSPSRWMRPWTASMPAERMTRRCCLEHLRPDDEIGDAGLVLDGDEHDALGRARPLADQHEAGGLEPAAVAGLHRLGAGDDAPCGADRRAGRRPDGCAASGRHGRSPRRPRRRRSSAGARRRARRSPARSSASRAEAAANSGSGSSRSALIAQSASRRARPQRRPEGVGLGELHERRRPARRRGARDRRPRRRARSARAATIAAASALARPLHHAQAEPDGEAVFVVGRLQRAVPAGGVDADRPDLDAMLARVAHDLGRRVEAHRLRVQQRGAEDVRMPALQPGRGIGDQREGGGVAFRESRSCRSPRAA